MKNVFTPFLLICLFSLKSVFSYSQSSTDIFISEYVEGSSNNKALEFYNATGSPIDLAAGQYVVQMYFNGSTSAGNTVSLTGTIGNNQTFVLANSSASFATASYVNQTAGGSWYNGDDAVVLRKGGASGPVVDVIGQIGVDPGTEWGTDLTSTADNTIRRKTSICTGDTNGSDAFNPSVEWDGFAIDDFSGLGQHTSDCSILGISISVMPQSLSFTANVENTSDPKSYFLKGSQLSEDVIITAPQNFLVAANSNDAYANTITIPVADANAGKLVYVVYNPSEGGIQTGTITNTSGDETAEVSVQGTAVSNTITHIYTIQGSDSTSPFDGSIINTEGIVTADFQATGQLGGYFIQDVNGDGDTSTSDGIFIFNTSFDVKVGDMVRVTGEVDEFNGLTEIKNVSNVSIISSSNALMEAANVYLPVTTKSDLEKYEGMLVVFPGTLTVTETFNLSRYGELSLSSNGRLFNPTNVVDPNDDPSSGTTSIGNSNIAAVTAQQDLNNRRTIYLDDASNIQNPAIVPFLNPVDTTLRCGTTIKALSGVLTYSFGDYYIETTTAPAFDYAARPSVPSVGDHNIKVSSFNVLNYFNGNGSGGGFPTARGANTLQEFNRQRAKIIAAISQIDADVIGLTEIENDGDGPNSAIADLVNGLNEATAPGTYAYINDPTGSNGNTGTDAIKVAIVYKPSNVNPIGAAMADTSAINNRPPLAQTFQLNSNGEKATIIINHFKSKGCTDATGLDIDQNDGQGCYNNRRRIQADSLLSFIAKMQEISGDSDVIAVGDFNAYDEEDPIDRLRAGGLTDILPGTYSYVFDGQSGSLDHGFVTSTLVSSVTGAAKWHINADEPVAKDYNQEFNQPYLYSAGPYRSSDHDPVLAGLNLQHQNIKPVIAITQPQNNTHYNAGETIVITVNAKDEDGSITHVNFYFNNAKLVSDSVAPYSALLPNVEGGTYQLKAVAYDNEDDSTVSDLVTVIVDTCKGSGWIAAEYYTNIPGTTVASLTNSSKYPDHPYTKALFKLFETASNVGNRYGTRVRGYICPSQTGYYTFNIASDDNSELWLSTGDDTASIKKIAYLNRPVSKRAWNVYTTQKSAPVYLIKGKRYFVQALFKESVGNDHLAVGWTLPNGRFEGPIAGKYLTPFDGKSASVNNQNISLLKLPDATDELTLNVSPNPSTNYFTIRVSSDSQEKIMLKVSDVAGRLMETKELAGETIAIVGSKYKPGIYVVEAIQGSQRKMIKLVKQ